MIFNIKKGKKVKIKDIIIHGRNKIKNPKKTFLNKQDSIFAISDRKIRKSLKETKVKNPWRLFKKSKFIDANYHDDKKNLITAYNEVGYRDARVIKDTFYINNDNNITVEFIHCHQV